MTERVNLKMYNRNQSLKADYEKTKKRTGYFPDENEDSPWSISPAIEFISSVGFSYHVTSDDKTRTTLLQVRDIVEYHGRRYDAYVTYKRNYHDDILTFMEVTLDFIHGDEPPISRTMSWSSRNHDVRNCEDAVFVLPGICFSESVLMQYVNALTHLRIADKALTESIVNTEKLLQENRKTIPIPERIWPLLVLSWSYWRDGRGTETMFTSLKDGSVTQDDYDSFKKWYPIFITDVCSGSKKWKTFFSKKNRLFAN